MGLYHCQNPRCQAQVESSKLLFGEPCTACEIGQMDDWPCDVEIGGPISEEDRYNDDLNRQYAKDRA